MSESTEATVAVLKVQVATILKDMEKREKVEDARHAEMIATLQALSVSVTSAQSFNRGVTAAVKTFWAIVGGLATAGVGWLMWGRPG